MKKKVRNLFHLDIQISTRMNIVESKKKYNRSKSKKELMKINKDYKGGNY